MHERMRPLKATLLSLIIASCAAPATRTSAQVAPKAPVSPPPPSVEAPEEIASSVHLRDATPTDAAPTQMTKYRLSGAFDYNRHCLSVDQSVVYTNSSNEPLDELLFVVDANRRPGVFRLEGLSLGAGESLETSTLDADKLRIALSDPLPPGSSIAVSLAYKISLPAQAGRLGYTSRQTNLGDWYPFVPPYQSGLGWVVHEAAPFGEYLVYEVADYEVDIELIDPPPGLTLAASAQPQIEGDIQHYRLLAGRSFAWSACTDCRVRSEVLGPVTILSYYFPEHLAAGEVALNATSRAMTLFSDLFLQYPRDTISVVEADFPDGMEYDGLSFVGKEYYAGYSGDARGYLTVISVHETAHQWWYGLVGNDQALEPWLDEALATYSEVVFFERYYPDHAAWWWDFRVRRFSPSGWVDSTVYEHHDFQSYVNAVYLRGALFLQESRDLLGDELFFQMLRNYCRSNARHIATEADFLTVLSEVDGVGLSAIMDRYLRP